MAVLGSSVAEPAVAAVPQLPTLSPILLALEFPAWQVQAGLVAFLRMNNSSSAWAEETAGFVAGFVASGPARTPLCHHGAGASPQLS